MHCGLASNKREEGEESKREAWRECGGWRGEQNEVIIWYASISTEYSTEYEVSRIFKGY